MFNTIDRYGPEGLSRLIKAISDKAVNFQKRISLSLCFCNVDWFLCIINLFDFVLNEFSYSFRQ